MQVAVLSDIHSNRHALEAVLEDVARTAARELWCLGDVVGYGADPNDCVRLVRDHAAICLAGNHDLGVTGSLALDQFSPGAALAAEWTREVIDDDCRDWLAGLSPSGERSELELFHGSPLDPVWEYVMSVLLADRCFDGFGSQVGLIGHSHVACSFERRDGESASGGPRRCDELAELPGSRWLLNPGSVGQPRDGDPRAAWLLLDLSASTASWRRAEYDVDGAASAIRTARLPDSLAERLQYGQ
jgi:diadenosine tetraphosphatase ApaH/serine/threonine PP2A family protein phosphatase